MKKTLHTLTLIFSALAGNSFAQTLPPVAQALYNEAYLQDSLLVQYTLAQGAEIVATPDSNSFYIKWFPIGAPPAGAPLIVTLHGSHGFAFHEFKNWHDQALTHNCGIIALQWYRGAAAIAPNDYFNDTEIYTDIDSALSEIGYLPNRAFFHGFSRGSARSYAVIFNDSHGGKNYFCSSLSNAGSADLFYPLYSDITSGVYGANVFAGKHLNLFCGGEDPDSIQSGCIGMSNTKNWLLAQGATVDIFIADDTLGHDGFHTVPVYMDSILDNYVTCFYAAFATDVNETAIHSEIVISPNPFNTQFAIETKKQFRKMSVMNTFGQTIKQLDVTATSHDLSFLKSGLYFLVFQEADGTIVTKKIMKE
jgi:Secretion system C-terminal sorting domain